MEVYILIMTLLTVSPPESDTTVTANHIVTAYTSERACLKIRNGIYASSVRDNTATANKVHAIVSESSIVQTVPQQWSYQCIKSKLVSPTDAK
jgi:hypothetical protein